MSLRALRRKALQVTGINWIVNYSHMIEVSLIGYLVSGAFLGLGYFDLFYHLAATTIVLKILFQKEARHFALAQPNAQFALPEPEEVTV